MVGEDQASVVFLWPAGQRVYLSCQLRSGGLEITALDGNNQARRQQLVTAISQQFPRAIDADPLTTN